MAVSSAKVLTNVVLDCGMSAVYNVYNNGPRNTGTRCKFVVKLNIRPRSVGGRTPVRIECETGWTAEPVCTVWGEEISYQYGETNMMHFYSVY
jgi:hypothetical protein